MLLSFLLSQIAWLLLGIVGSILLQLMICALGDSVLVKRGIIFDLLRGLQILHICDLCSCKRVEKLQRRATDFLVDYNGFNRLFNRVCLECLLLELISLIFILISSYKIKLNH